MGGIDLATDAVPRAWNRVYEDTRASIWVPDENVARFAARHLFHRIGPRQIETRRPIQRILDLGCGSGRHVVFFAGLGLPVVGIDVSDRALDACRAWLSEEGLEAELGMARVDDLPYPTDHFDVAVSHGVLDHVTLAEARSAIAELRRVLRPGGLLHLNLRMTESYDWGRGEEIEPGTFRLAEGPERGLPQHFYSEAEIEDLLEGLHVLDWETQIRLLDREETRRDTRCAVTAELP